MIITTQLTEDYYEKARPLFESIEQHWPHRFVPGFIDFWPPDYTGDCYTMHRKHIHTYSDNYPANRKRGFVCPQGGEFIHYLDCGPDEVVIEIDADTVMQRPMTDDELAVLSPADDELMVVYGANPAPTLVQAARNIGITNAPKSDHLEFTASFLVARASTFMKLKNHVVANWKFILNNCRHHAGIQWLISYLAYSYFKVTLLDNIYQCADWYIDFDTEIRDGNLYLGSRQVIFNHTKFIKY